MSAESAVAELKEFLVSDPTKVFPVEFKPVPSVTVPARSMFDPDHSEIVCFNVSDWHIGEVVNPLAINGMNEHNTLIAAGKIWQLAEKFARIVRRHQMMYQIEKIWVLGLGDMISGSIHRELVLSNDLLDIPATVLGARLLIMLLERLKCLGLPIEFDGVVGNHPRTTETMPTKVQAITNLDWICYEMVKTHFDAKQDEQVTMRVHLSQHALVTQKGHRIVVEHGYGTKFEKAGELDTKLRNVFDNDEVRDFTGNTGSSVDFVVIGDKHRAACQDYVMVNGSLPGASELTPSWRLRPIKAVQQCWGISDEHIPSFYYPLTVSSAECKAVTNPMSKYVQGFMKVYGR